MLKEDELTHNQRVGLGTIFLLGLGAIMALNIYAEVLNTSPVGVWVLVATQTMAGFGCTLMMLDIRQYLIEKNNRKIKESLY